MSSSTRLTPEAKEVLAHIKPHIAEMTVGDVTDPKGLFDPEFWKSSPLLHKQLGRAVSLLAHQGHVPLEPAGFNSSRHNRYRKI